MLRGLHWISVYVVMTAFDLSLCCKDGARAQPPCCEDGARAQSPCCKDGARAQSPCCEDGAGPTGGHRFTQVAPDQLSHNKRSENSGRAAAEI